MTLREKLSDGSPLLLDGSMGALLMAGGLRSGEIYSVNSLNPEILIKIHDEYLKAGSDIILTNTFNLSDEISGPLNIPLEKLIYDACTAAKTAAQKYEDRYVALNIGPCPKLVSSSGRTDASEVFDYFACRIKASEGIADAVFFETFSSAAELETAVAAAKSVTDVPVFASFTFMENKRTWMGDEFSRSFERILAASPDAAGLNCTLTPSEMLPLARSLAEAAGGRIRLLAEPNRGVPRTSCGEVVYDMPAQEFADGTAEIFNAGITIIGGCCGSDPECIKLIREKCFS